MGKSSPKLSIAVTSNSFSKDQRLREEATSRFPQFQFKFCDPSQKWSEELIADFIQDSYGWIVGKEPVNRRTLQHISNLRLVSKYGVGLDNIAFEDCHHRGVDVYFETGVNSAEVAEQAIASMIGISRNLFKSSWMLKGGHWVKDGGWNFSGKTVGVVGCGHVGRRVAVLASAFGCRILVCDVRDLTTFCSDTGAVQVPFSEILESSDFLSLHVPLDSTTKSMIDADTLSRMKPSSYLINTSRGQVVDQEALYHALRQGLIGGAVLDVYADEPNVPRQLKELDNFVGTPHIAGNSREAVWKMGQAALKGLEKILPNR